MPEIMTSLTVGRVSGLIALGNWVVTFTVPLLLCFLLVRHLNTTLSAASWSVLARQLHSSAWPSLLRSDSVARTNVDWRVSAVAYTNLALALIGVISGVVTPLGLGEAIRRTSPQSLRFDYVQDLSSFGNATTGLPNMSLSRDCMLEYYVCPGAFAPESSVVGNTSRNASIASTTRIPTNITAMFTSATNSTTLASIFDIQYRSWFPYKSNRFDNQQAYPRGQLVHIDYLLSRDDVVVLEGVVADMRSGGIGYRNHTAPVGLAYGAEWEEDILWVEPDISCANTNLSLQITVDDEDRMDPLKNPGTPLRSVELFDQGGLASLPRGSPTDDWPGINYTSPNVALRASRTAWLSNFLTALALNLSDTQAAQYGLNVTQGHHYKLDLDQYSQGDFMAVHSDGSLSGKWLNIPYLTREANGSLTMLNGTLIENPFDHPYLLAAALFNELGGRCTGELSETAGNLATNVQCAHVFGTPSRIDGGPPLVQDPGSQWQVPMHVCAGAIKASVKTITFVANGSSPSLDSLSVRGIKDKVYQDSEAYPLWAMEDKWYAGSEGASPAPLWGIVQDSYHGTPGYNFSKAPTFYVPYGWAPSEWNLRRGPLDILAGSMPYATLTKVLGVAFGSTLDNVPHYSGRENVALQSRWRTLSKEPGGTELLLRLVWTDIMASTTVGTVLYDEVVSTAAGNAAKLRRSISVYNRQITYDMRYAVPAMLFLISWLSLLIMGLIRLAISRRSPSHLRQLLNQTSLGRVAIGRSYGESRDLMHESTVKWLGAVGRVPVRLGVRSSSNLADAETISTKYVGEVYASDMALLPTRGKATACSVEAVK